MNNARDRLLSSPIYSDAIERLIGKLLVPDHLISNERKECLAKMTTLFFDEQQMFMNQTGILNNDTMWLGRMTLLLPVDGTILGHYQEPRYLANWLAWFYQKF
jgi:hypothetical protein